MVLVSNMGSVMGYHGANMGQNKGHLGAPASLIAVQPGVPKLEEPSLFAMGRREEVAPLDLIL